MQNLSYAGLILGINSPSNLKAATSIDYFKQDIKKYFLNKLSDTEADIYGWA